MLYLLKTRKYYGNARQVLEIIPSIAKCVWHAGEATVFNGNYSANGDIWKLDDSLLFSTSDDMSELTKCQEVLLVYKTS